ncbi:MAG: dTDP-4-dehydrorhamnose 3,5-epimerase [Proteobacteria bacterium]|nr:dTDP-4-dehydrorhamnose 3,5-epimerase [Pseudomonadota bacterium]MBI3499638.1 dTDP-4-dehydrorhamnose 3,5-epimerase [Pseudomonadota bacterium]
MKIESTAIPEVKIIWPRKFGDNRGFFSDTYNRRAFAEAGIDVVFQQDNHSLSADQGTVRGLHYQRDPFAQAKLVRVTKGAILDVAVDIRHGSPSFGGHVAVEVSADSWNQVYIPEGFAHGFCTLAPDTEVIYKVTSLYSPEHEVGVMWNDPDLKIAWPVDPASAVLSAKDAVLPRLAELPRHFVWRGIGA